MIIAESETDYEGVTTSLDFDSATCSSLAE